MKIDPYNHKEKYLNWKEKIAKIGISEISKENSDIILRYLSDMEKGINIASGSVKGSRSFIRLVALRNKLTMLAKKIQEIYKINMLDISEEQLMGFFSDMKNGIIPKTNGKTYTSVDNYAKVFKAFWHWHQKISRKGGIEVKEITQDLDTKQEKPDWVYLTEEQVKLLSDNAKPEYKALIIFLFDTGIRAPTELMNIKVSDFFHDFKELQIRDEISKTFGRRIKLMLCHDLIKEYVKSNELKPEDYLFTKAPFSVNLYLKRLAKRVLGDGVSPAGEKYCNISMYDFRHISCCYWLPRYKSESALKYRFGWKKSDKIHYYSELLGMKDTIVEEDLLVDVTKTEIEKRLLKSEKDKEILQERVNTLEEQMKRIMEWTNQLHSKAS